MPPGSAPHDFQASARDAAGHAGGRPPGGQRRRVRGGAGRRHRRRRSRRRPWSTRPSPRSSRSPSATGEGVDPHFFTDPARMADAAVRSSPRDSPSGPRRSTRAEVRAGADAYLAELECLDAEVERVLARRPRRRAACSSPTTRCSATSPTATASRSSAPSSPVAAPWPASAAELAALADGDRRAGRPGRSSPTPPRPPSWPRPWPPRSGDVEVVVLFSESLGEPGSGGETYIDMVRTNAQRIAAALGEHCLRSSWTGPRCVRARVHAAGAAGRAAWPCVATSVVGHLGRAAGPGVPGRRPRPRGDPRHRPRRPVGLQPDPRRPRGRRW